MSIKSRTLGVLVVVLVFVGTMLGDALNMWVTEASKMPDIISEGEARGAYDPADIKGSFSFGEISRLYDIPMEDLAVAFALPAGADAERMLAKDMSNIYAGQDFDLGTGSIRYFVSLYHNLPYEKGEDTLLLSSAVALLKERGTLGDEDLAYLETHTIEIKA